MSNIPSKMSSYFCSDLHYSQRNICRGVSKWLDKETNCRDFETVEEMNLAIVDSINSIVNKRDTLYHLGDWSLGGWKNIWELRKQIICRTIIQINGNHDENIANDIFFPFLEKEDGIVKEILDKTKYHDIPMLKRRNDVTAKDIFTSVHNSRIKIIVDGQEIVLDHFPLEEWEGMSKGTWHLHGHSHHKLNNSETSTRFKRMDVGWDGNIFSFKEIKDIMQTRENKPHHK